VTRIATLGPRGTCSEDVSLAYLRRRGLAAGGCLRLTDSYEDAVELVLSGEADAVVVPAAYRDYNEISFSHLERLRLVDMLYSTPSFVLVAPSEGGTEAECPRVACHPSPSPLLRQLSFRFEHVLAPSNAAAARMVLDGQADLAVTFCGSYDAYRDRLRVTRSFGAVDMVWAVLGPGRAGSAVGAFWAAGLGRASC
jgi:prephenate dehydratase